MTGGGHEPTHGEDQTVSEAEQSHPHKQTVCLLERGFANQASEPALKTVKSQGLITERNDGPGCSIPGLRRMHIFFRIRLTPQTAVSECPGQGPQDHSQGSGVQGIDLPENEKEAALREVWGPGPPRGRGSSSVQ